jgi:hypothetical protein
MGASWGALADNGSSRAGLSTLEVHPAVVRVVRNPVAWVPQKYPAPLTIKVNSGSLRLVKNAECPAFIGKSAGR